MTCHARSHVYRPTSAREVARALADARARGLTVAARGAGLSYGDVALNQGGAVISSAGLDRVLDIDGERGTVRAQAGVTIERLWTEVLPAGWWPPVVPGTMKVTLGGAVALDVHGKNHFVRGSIGDHVQAVTLVGADGEPEVVAGEGLDRVIGAQGLTGTIVDVTLRLHRIHSGYLDVTSLSTPSLAATLEVMERRAPDAEYAVAWVDSLSRRRPGRGIVHLADDLPEGHPLEGRGLTVADQALPPRLFGILPREHAWRVLDPFTSDGGMRFVNAARWWTGRLRDGQRYTQTRAAFHFLLDSLPGWKRVYRPHGLIQYQLFVPREAAAGAFREAFRLQQELGVYAYLGVIKRHRACERPASYLVDGYSLALDFPVRPDRLDRLGALCRRYGALLEDVGGRLYAAKDAVGRGRLPPGRDPLFSSNLVRRWER